MVSMLAGGPTPPRPLLFLDVDGVLAPYTGPCQPTHQEHALFPGEDPVRLDLAQGAWLIELTQSFDVVWATGWGEGANEVLAPMYRLPQLPLVALPVVPFEPEAKVPAVAAFAGERPLVWLDDLHTEVGRAWAAARDRPTLLLDVDPHEGLTRAHVDHALAFARAQAQHPPVG